jgi:hypothetical protein
MEKKLENSAVNIKEKRLRAIPTPPLKLATIEDCRREMARVYRDARSGATDTQDASRLVYILTSIAKMLAIGGTIIDVRDIKHTVTMRVIDPSGKVTYPLGNVVN